MLFRSVSQSRYGPDSSDVYLKKGIILAALGKPMEAVADFSQAIKLKSNNPDAFYNRGNIYFQQKNYTEANTDFEKSIEINPNFGKAYYALGLSYYYANQKDKTCISIKQAMRLNYPGTPSFHGLTGGVYKARERIHRVIADIRVVSDSSFMQASCSLQSELRGSFWDWLHIAMLQPFVFPIVVRV